MAERLGAPVSRLAPPYAHFADREDLLAAVAVRACDVFHSQFLQEIRRSQGPAARLAGITRCYVRFAGFNRPLLEVLFLAGIDKRDHSEVEAAEKPLSDAVLDCVRALSGGEQAAARAAAATLALVEGRRLLSQRTGSSAHRVNSRSGRR